MKLVPYFMILAVWTCAVARAEPKVAPIFSDHMVLQRDMPVVVWGTAAAGEKVKVEFGGQTAEGMADASGQWRVELAPLAASAEPREMKVGATTFSDVLVGEVWLCAGQSNMEWALGRSTGGVEAVAGAANAQLRLCTIPHNPQMTPQETVATRWVVSGPGTTKTFSAIAWWFGSKLQKELGVPVGVINDSYGGTTIQGWMPTETLRKGPWPQDRMTDLALAKADYDRRAVEFAPKLEKYRAQKEAALAEKKEAPPMPAGGPGDFRGPGMMWNGMVAPLLKLRFRGVAWYQGESNAYVGVADPYGALLTAMIADWREGFGRPDLPMVVYQIASNRKPQTDPNELSGIAVLQEAQFKTVQRTPKTALVVTIDLGESDVHYKNKEPAADRGVKAALALAYGREVVASGPAFKGCRFEEGRAVVSWDHVYGGLEVRERGGTQPAEGAVSGFVIAGEDQKFVFADAKIEGETVIVSSPAVTKPVAVRYAWADYPKVNLYNREGFPAGPFRTDEWSVGKGAK
jgi:sialate O-acetylesterase